MQSDENTKIINDVTEIIQFMGQSKLAEIELETNTFNMKLKKHNQVVYKSSVEPNVTTASNMASIPVVSISNLEKVVNNKTNITENNNYKKIISPMAGNFYVASSPTAAPFVKIGDSVNIGQTLCIVEAMKMMNEIKSDVSGKIVAILGKNAEAVEKGNVLFHIE